MALRARGIHSIIGGEGESSKKTARQCSIILLLLLVCPRAVNSYSYDPFDPNGNITIKWDLMQLTDSGYVAMVDINNYQLFRHVERPGWKLKWEWPGDEVIWDIRGAEASEQGNCSKYKGQLPHCCLKWPVVVDLLPGTPYNYQVRNCCKAGVLSSITQGPSSSAASFQIDVGNIRYGKKHEVLRPRNFALGLHGYTCGEAIDSDPTKFLSGDKRRKTQALHTWKVTCSYSQFIASASPSCCVSLSTFYSSTIVECPHCSCGCPDGPSAVKSQVLQFPNDGDSPPPFVRCTQHMCPIQIHWHVKVSYREYWRVKVTVTNYNLVHNYSEWNLVVNHPNLERLTQVFSFEHEYLRNYGPINDTAMFWGIPYYNDILLQYGESGNVQTEMLLRKDPAAFTFKAGWTFPRRIMFNGEDCVMPPPDLYPQLPSSYSGGGDATTTRAAAACLLLLGLLLLDVSVIS
ncbi:unnamed protein product [Spirodela intermedia]|uniref:COBRA-like protein n=1 Tax=Spirodela intermedia TaxID=51605 RepID=A0A7I8KPR7_SPIIN|nr:unnamed protein product [Spirodela intermedia]